MRILAGLVLPALLLAGAPAAADADLGGLRVQGLPWAWHANRVFEVEWAEPASGPVKYRFTNAPWDEGTYSRATSTAMQVPIPVPPWAALPPPGEYVVEIWIGNGTPSQLRLRYDPSAPGPPQVTVPSDWIDSRSQIPVAIEPPGYIPPSTVFGYAYAVSANPGETPCAAPAFCIDPTSTSPVASAAAI